jgi:pimeloyl-ACP methyl ester carboxylesterase
VILNALKWFLIVGLVALVAVAAALTIGSRMSMDQQYQHTQRTAALPAFATESAEAVVRIKAAGYDYRARVAGFADAEDRPGIILLHGFPVSSAMWNAIIDPLASEGYRVVAFDQRGYSPGARPDGAENYLLPTLVADVLAVADAVGFEEFHLVGHDWGAAVGWSTVMAAPERIITWTGISVAHPAAFAAALQDDPDQKARSSYFAFFVTPWLPETLFSFNNFEMLKSLYVDMSAAQREEYLEIFGEPGALTAALNWYRSMLVEQPDVQELEVEITTPTLFIWGNNDPSAGRVAVDGQAQYMKGPYSKMELSGGHWLMTDFPRVITEAVIEHLYTYGDRDE